MSVWKIDPVEYQILESCDAPSLTDKVNQYTQREGWALKGAPFMVPEYERPGLWFYQAVYRPLSREKK